MVNKVSRENSRAKKPIGKLRLCDKERVKKDFCKYLGRETKTFGLKQGIKKRRRIKEHLSFVRMVISKGLNKKNSC